MRRWEGTRLEEQYRVWFHITGNMQDVYNFVMLFHGLGYVPAYILARTASSHQTLALCALSPRRTAPNPPGHVVAVFLVLGIPVGPQSIAHGQQSVKRRRYGGR